MSAMRKSSTEEETEDMGSEKEWRKALRASPNYRIINRTLRNQTYFISMTVLASVVLLIVFYLWPKRNQYVVVHRTFYNNTYPLSSPLRTNDMYTFRIGAISDLDTNSKSDTEKDVWFAYLKKGYLSYSPKNHKIVVSWDEKEPIRLTSSYALKGRGMELSELVVFDGRLLSFDDRTGFIYEIMGDKAVPWVLLMHGNGKNTKGFKSEWATVKNEVLYVGSMGKEWTTADGVFENNDPMFIKAVTPGGEVHHIDWQDQYKRIRGVLGIQWPGYMIHESGVWSDVHKKWFFLPRRCSSEPYNEVADEKRGCSVIISADEDVYDVKVVEVPNTSKTRGFSSFKFLPTTEDSIIVALRTEEVNGKTATYITAFTVEGKILLEDTLVADLKYEGLEFI